MDQSLNGSSEIDVENLRGNEESSQLSSTLHNAFYLSHIIAFIDVLL